MPLNETGVTNILKKYGSLNEFVKSHLSYGAVAESELEESTEIVAHAQAELLLLKIGRMLGYDTYSPDKNAEAYGEPLSKYITLTDIPTRFLGGEIYKIVKEIDVLWFKEEVAFAAFEVEHSTKVASGLQRLCQLTPLNVKLFIIASSKDQYRFDKYINTDPYYKNKKAYRFRNYKQLENFFKEVDGFSAIKDTFLG